MLPKTKKTDELLEDVERLTLALDGIVGEMTPEQVAYHESVPPFEGTRYDLARAWRVLQGVKGNCDHNWEFVDDSFDHEFGCEKIHYERCSLCDATRECDHHDNTPDFP